jgi:hypothetical protein
VPGTNRNRVLLGGLLAGLVINVGEFLLNVPIAGGALEAAANEAGLAPPSAAVMAVYVGMAFTFGIVAVWLYAAIRPRYGAGPATAVRAGFVIWLIGYAFPTVSLGAMGLFPAGLLLLVAAWGMVEIPLATLAGAWAYREAEAPVAAEASSPASPSMM